MIILDTNVLSELMRPKPSPRVIVWVAKQSGTELFTTSITEAEIFYGIEFLAKGKRREELLAAAEAMFAEDLAGRVFGSRAMPQEFCPGLPLSAVRLAVRLATRMRRSQPLLKREEPNSRLAMLQISGTAAWMSLTLGMVRKRFAIAALHSHTWHRTLTLVPAYRPFVCQKRAGPESTSAAESKVGLITRASGGLGRAFTEAVQRQDTFRQAFHPLTLLVTGTGSISVAITLGAGAYAAHRHAFHPLTILAALMGLVLIAISIFLCYGFAEQLARIDSAAGPFSLRVGRDR